jgi:plastocyanin
VNADLPYRLVAALVAVAGLVFADHRLTAGATPATHTVIIEGTRFEPESLTVRPGDTVVWINKGSIPSHRDRASRRLRLEEHCT